MIQPEAWLASRPERQARIPAAMRRMLADGTLQPAGEGLVYVRRQTSSGVRCGLVAQLDLSRDDVEERNRALIRPTEKTVRDRLPARVAIRKEAPLDLPHAMVLFADRGRGLMRMLAGWADAQEALGVPALYDFDLMQGGGHITGRLIDDPLLWEKIADLLLALKETAPDGMLYAVGDGNHSLAAAKLCGSAFALVELVDLYDDALRFEPIHRLLTGVDPLQVQRELGFDASCPPDLQVLQPALDAWLARHPEASLEYIHGRKTCEELAKKPGSLAICWDRFDKDGFFEAVAAHGVLCRKSFSMGEARDKRYYLEACPAT